MYFMRLHQDSSTFQLHRGVIQGDTILPKLSILVWKKYLESKIGREKNMENAMEPKQLFTLIHTALYLHCHSHQLNLDISISSEVTFTCNCWNTVQSIVNLIAPYPQRNKCMKKKTYYWRKEFILVDHGDCRLSLLDVG